MKILIQRLTRIMGKGYIVAVLRGHTLSKLDSNRKLTMISGGGTFCLVRTNKATIYTGPYSREAKARKNNVRAPERVKATTRLKWLNIAPSSLTGRWSPSVRVEGFCRGHQVHWPKTGNISEIQFLDIR